MKCPKPGCGRELEPLHDDKDQPVSGDWYTCRNPAGAHRYEPFVKDGGRWWRDEDGSEHPDPDQSEG